MWKRQYGYAHKKARRDALAAFKDGTLCPICHRPMRVWMSLDLNHIVPVALGGSGGRTALAHSKCNRGQGTAIAAVRKRNPRIKKVVGSGGSPRKQLPKW